MIIVLATGRCATLGSALPRDQWREHEIGEDSGEENAHTHSNVSTHGDSLLSQQEASEQWRATQQFQHCVGWSGG